MNAAKYYSYWMGIFDWLTGSSDSEPKDATEIAKVEKMPESEKPTETQKVVREHIVPSQTTHVHHVKHIDDGITYVNKGVMDGRRQAMLDIAFAHFRDSVGSCIQSAQASAAGVQNVMNEFADRFGALINTPTKAKLDDFEEWAAARAGQYTSTITEEFTELRQLLRKEGFEC